MEQNQSLTEEWSLAPLACKGTSSTNGDPRQEDHRFFGPLRAWLACSLGEPRPDDEPRRIIDPPYLPGQPICNRKERGGRSLRWQLAKLSPFWCAQDELAFIRGKKRHYGAHFIHSMTTAAWHCCRPAIAFRSDLICRDHAK